MSLAADNSGEWTRTRWLLTVLGVMGLQVGLIFALGERRPPKLRVVGTVQSLQLTAARTDLQELQDPTLFARPHARDFSASSWLRVVAPAFPVFRWTEPTRPLELRVNQLGQALSAFLRTNVFTSYALEARPLPEMLTRRPDNIAEAVPARSELFIAGPLAARALLNPPVLPPWPAADLLTNTVVQVQVDDGGKVLSAVMLGAERMSGGSGSPDADRLAMALAGDFRFAPNAGSGWLASPVSPLTRGILIFKWRTERATNGVAAPTSPP